MTSRKLIAPDAKLELSLSEAERQAVVECTLVIDPTYQDRVRRSPPGKTISYTLDELEDLHGMLAAAANRAESPRSEKLLDEILLKIERLLDSHTDQPPIAYPSGDAAPPETRPMADVNDVPAEFRDVFSEIVALTDQFCEELLNDEYKHLCREMTLAICDPESPVVRGKRASWACGIVYSLGQINFLSDPSSQPYVRSEDVAKWFGVSTATMHSKSKVLREGLELTPLDPDFTLPSRLADNPLIWMFEVDGLALDIRHAPREVQQAALEQGLIPFLPHDPADADLPDEPYDVIYQRVPQGKRDGPKPSIPSEPTATQACYQLKVTLNDSQPPIWRRLRVPDCTLRELHEVIQIAMGWENCHMHEFEAGGDRFVGAGPDGPLFDDGDDDVYDEADVLLSQVVDQGHKKLQYWYDFGDDWRHTIAVEKVLDPPPDDRGPTCLAGARACPPEDIGGLWGYYDYLEAIADPQHERRDELVEMLGDQFDEESFDAEAINRQLS